MNNSSNVNLSESGFIATSKKLRTLNFVIGSAHFLSAAIMLALSNGFELTVSTFNLNGPPGTSLSEGRIESVLSFPLAWGTTAFLFLSAFFHLLVVIPGFFKAYCSEISKEQNRFRWIEYSLSSTLMIILIAMITGITDLAALIAIAFANVAMILFGWLMELVNNPGNKTWWTPFNFGCIAGVGPWLAIGTYLLFNINQNGAQGPPNFVYAILITIFILFNCFAINQWLQYKKIGSWSDYVFGEVIYILLSLTAKSVLAWQIFANTLIN